MEQNLDRIHSNAQITDAARNLATPTKTTPMMEELTPRWILDILPWVQVDSGTYRVNRRNIMLRNGSRIKIIEKDGQVTVDRDSLKYIPLFSAADETVFNLFQRT